MSEAFNYQQVVFGVEWELHREDYNLGGLRLDLALKALEAQPELQEGRILEAGCGVGRFTAPLSEQLPAARLIAFDLSKAAVLEASRCRCCAGYGVADALCLPYADGSFDAVLFFDLLEHLEPAKVALAEFARVTRPRGLLHGYVPCEGQPATLHWLLGRRMHTWTRRHAGHIQHYRHQELLGQVQQAGFELVDLYYSYHLLGQALDVATFAGREVVFRRQRKEQERPEAYYDRSVLGCGGVSQAYGVVRRIAEFVAYWETRLLHWCPWALGIHLTARRR
jgi:ubiquinone/menaquinone biosynthesis C-methylase UbiE